MKASTFPRHFPLSRVRYNAPNAWPDADLMHVSIMDTLARLTPAHRFARYHFHLNEDGTITPLARATEWQLAAFRAMGRKTFRLD